MDDELRIRLLGADDATPSIQRVTAAFDALRVKYEEVANLMSAQSGMDVPLEAVAKAAQRAGAVVAATFDQLGEHNTAVMARLQRQIDTFEQAQARAAERTAIQVSAARQRAFEADWAREQRLEESILAGQRKWAEGAQTASEQAIQASRRATAEQENWDARLAKFVENEQAAERKSREDTFFVAQAANQKLVQSAQASAQAEARAVEEAMASERKYREDLFFFVQGENQRLLHAEEQQAAQEARLRANANAGLAGRGSGGIGTITSLLGGLGGAGRGAVAGAAGLAGGVLEAGLSGVGNAVKGVTGFFASLTEGVGHAVGKVGEFIALGVGIYSAYEVVNLVERMFHDLGGAVVEFQDKMVQVQSLRLGTTLAAEFKDVQAAVIETSMLTGRSATELGNALFFIEGHGYNAAQALTILTNAAKLSASGLGETDQLVRIVTGQMVAYGAKAEEAGHFFDVFARTEQLAALPIGELSGQFQRLTPITAALKIPIEQVGAAIATISRTGLGASRVVTDLAGVLNSFVKSTPQQQEALKKIGYPIEQLRKDLMEKGLIETLTTIWQKSAHDIDAAGAIFGDRSRALVGFLALVRQSGTAINEVYDQMANNAGTVEKIFSINQERISLQWQRLTAVAQGYAIVLTNEVAPGVGRAMGAIVDRLAAGDLVGAWQSFIGAASNAGTAILNTLETLAQQAFGGAYNVAVEIAKGLWSGAVDAINSVVNAIADMIASFLLGNSWPPKGALSQGTQGVQRWQKQYADTMNANSSVMTGAASNVATAVNTELGKIGGGGSKHNLELAIANIDQQLLPWKLAADSIKDSYNAMLHPLEAQITAIQRIKDLEYERQQLKFDERDLELRMMKMRAEGDPARRAALAGQMARAQETREQHSIEARIATLNREARNLRPGHGVTGQEIGLRRREIADELQILNLQRQQHGLINVSLLGQYEQKKAQLDVDKEISGIAHSQFDLEQKKVLQPLLEQRDMLKAKMQAELDIITKQTDGLEDQKRVLEAQLKLITAKEAGQKKAAGGGAGPFILPEDPLHLSDAVTKGADAVAGTLAEGLRTRLQTGIRDFTQTYGPTIGRSFMGFIVGGMVGGIPGAIAGAALVPKLLDALTARGVTGADLTRFATNFVTELRTTFGKVGAKLQAGDLLGSVEELMTSARKWIAGFETAFFREWTVSSAQAGDRGSGGREGAEATTTRYTGLGRHILESMAGGIINAPLDFSDLDKAVQDVLRRVYEHLTVASIVSTDAAGEQTLGPSLLSKAFSQLGNMLGEAIKGAAAGINANAPAAAAGAKTAGESLGDAIFGSMEDSMANPPASLLSAASRAGFLIGGSFLEGFASKIPVVGGIVKFMEWLDTIQTPGIASQSLTGQPTVLRTGPPAPRALPQVPVDAAPFMPDEVKTAGTDAANGIMRGFRDAWAADTAFKEDNSRFWRENVVQTAETVLGTGSPSRVFHDLGDEVLAGFQDAISSDNMTGAVVRVWLRSDVIAQARSILIIGEGKSGGLPGVATDALNAFADVFGTPPAQLAGNLHAFGVSIVDDIMEPIKDPHTGVVAQMRRVIDSIPHAPTRATPAGGGGGDTLPTPDAGARYAATGADFVVGGSGGTDSEHVNLWATPGERVQVGAGAGSRTGRQVNVSVTVNGGDSNEVQRAIAAGIKQGLADDGSGDEASNQLLNAWRTAKAQGANRPNGVQSRGARG